MDLESHCPQCSCHNSRSDDQPPEQPVSQLGLSTPTITELLRSNPPPSSAEREIAPAYVDELDEEMGHVKEEIHSIDSAVARVHRARAGLCDCKGSLDDSADLQRHILSINRFLPAEIVSEIFLHCLPDFPFDPSPALAPWVLGQVCRLWNKIAKSTPQLWSSLTLKIDRLYFNKYYPTHTYHDAMSLSISRSGECALSLDMTFAYTLSFDEVSTHPLFLLAARHSSRWKILHLAFAPANTDSVQAFVVLAGRLPLLQSLSVHMPYRPFDNLRNSSAFADAPRLRDVVLDCFDGVVLFSMPWGSLTCLNLVKFVADDRSMQILGQCTALVELSIKHDRDTSTPFALVEFPHLRSFTLTVLPCARRVFNLSTPALRYLDLTQSQREYSASEQPGQGSWPASDDFLAFLRRSKRGITSLKLSFQLRPEPEDLVLYLIETPHLEHLCMGDLGDVGGQILSAQVLQQLAEPARLVPQLQTLHMQCHWEAFPDEACAQMLRGRLATDPRIMRSFQLYQQSKPWLRRQISDSNLDPVRTVAALVECCSQQTMVIEVVKCDGAELCFGGVLRSVDDGHRGGKLRWR